MSQTGFKFGVKFIWLSAEERFHVFNDSDPDTKAINKVPKIFIAHTVRVKQYLTDPRHKNGASIDPSFHRIRK